VNRWKKHRQSANRLGFRTRGHYHYINNCWCGETVDTTDMENGARFSQAVDSRIERIKQLEALTLADIERGKFWRTYLMGFVLGAIVLGLFVVAILAWGYR
jgi:hypothetical protein